MNEEQKFEDYRNRLNIRDVLTDAGYTLHKRDGLRYPAYVRLWIMMDAESGVTNSLSCPIKTVVSNLQR